LKEFSSILRQFKIPVTKTKDEAWLLLLDKLLERSSSRSIERPKYGRFIAMVSAALIGFFLVTWFFVKTDQLKISTEYGEMATVYLPDSSIVILNSGTTIWYSPKSWNKQRLIKMEGEAFFKVKHGQKFSVIAFKTITSVLGTTFNVYARDTEVNVTCLTGKVKVMSNVSGTTTLLLPGTGTKVNRIGKLYTVNASIDNAAKWIDGKFFFQQEAIGKVFDEIERQFNVNIVYEGSRQRSYTGFFTNSSLTEALDLVCIPMQLRFQRVDSTTVKIFSSN